MLALIVPPLLILIGLIFKGGPSAEKKRNFECGFTPISNIRSPISIQFFLLVIFYLLFDVELCLFFPFLGATNLFFWVPASLILLFGILHEINNGAIQWLRY